MKRTKEQKGITLIALIITIVILLILASVAISSIQNDGILSYTENVVNKYNQTQRDEQSVIDKYLGYLKGDEWVTIYEGTETTVDGMLVLANKFLFTEGNSYRITVESDEFTGTVETKAILAESGNGSKVYILFGVTGGQAVTANSLNEYITILENMPEDAVYSIIVGGNIFNPTEGTMSVIGKMESTSDCEYTVRKIEEKAENNGELIFEGSLALNGTELTPIEGIKRNISPLVKTYRLDLIVDGVETTVYTEVGRIFSQVSAFALIGGSDFLFVGTEGNQSFAKLFMNAVTCEIAAIYEVGDVSNYVEESGFGAFYDSNNGTWDLVHTPSTDFVVPETVAGRTINRVILDSIMYQGGDRVITFTKDIEVDYYDCIARNLKFKIVSTDSEVVNSMVQRILDKTNNGIVIDLTECGDDIEFTNDTLTVISSKGLTINVTSAVKAKYQDNEYIVVPES